MMSSMFETEVYQNEHLLPFLRVNHIALMKQCALNPHDNEVRLTCKYRHDVSTSFWWTLDWTGEDGQARSAEGQTLDKCLWRAVTIMKHAESRQKAAEKGCTAETPCCERRDEYNGFGSDGLLSLTCPKSCFCHH